ncbi:MAG TPA: DUF4760 domain-containing protein [Anaerolineales bacterium]|nr:DUF4760 domain-containing protein [Anaerolineales bacterium]
MLITITVFLLLVCGLPALWCKLSAPEACGASIALIESLSTAVAAAAVFGAGFIAYRELSEVANSRYMDIADRLFEELNSAENIEARRRVFQNLQKDPEKSLMKMNAKDREAMKKVLNSLDHVAFLTQSGWIPEELVMPWMHPMIAKSWEKLEAYVLYERQRRNEPYYYQYAGNLAEKCRKWRTAHLSETTTKWVDHAL